MLNYELISEWGSIYRNGNKALKIYSSDDVAYDYVARAARIHSFLCDAGLPVPAAYGVRKISETETALEMDYIAAKPFMQEDISREEQEKALNIMANLQCMINSVDASGLGLPEFSEIIAEEIKKTVYLTTQIKEKVFDLLSRLDTKKTNLCHGDIHRHNILYDGEKHWVIDWESASIGDPAADACMTYFYQRRASPQFADIYLRSYCKTSGVNPAEILAWEPVIAAYQVNIDTEDEREFILNIINEWYESN